MPTYRGIVVRMHSQFDCQLLPEFPPRPQGFYTTQRAAGRVPLLYDDKKSTCSVYIPVLPGSQFWISYAVQPPVPSDQLFLFKLFINGVHVVSSSTGKDEGFGGKIMLGLFESKGEQGQKKIEKRILCFTPPENENGDRKSVV